MNILAKFCTNCGTKLEAGASFCTNCGTKAEHTETTKKTQPSFYDIINANDKKETSSKNTTTKKTPNKTTHKSETNKKKTAEKKTTTIKTSENKSSNKNFSIDKNITNKIPNNLSLDNLTEKIPDNLNIDKLTDQMSNKNEISKTPKNNEITTIKNNKPSSITDTKKQLKELVGGFTFSNEFSYRLKQEGLNSGEGNQIKNKLKKEVSSGKVDENALENRLDEIIKDMKTRQGQLEGKLKYVDEFFETEETQQKITDYKLNERKINNIKDSIKKDLQNDYYLEKSYVPRKTNEKLDSLHQREERLGICGYDFSCVLHEIRQNILGEEEEEIIEGYCFIEEDKITIKKISAILKIDKGNKVLRYSKINAIDYDKAGLLQFTSSIVIGVSGFPHVVLRHTTPEDFELLHDAWLEYNNPSKKEPSIEQTPIIAPVSNADELMKYAELYEKGFLTEEEFNGIKKKLLDL